MELHLCPPMHRQMQQDLGVYAQPGLYMFPGLIAGFAALSPDVRELGPTFWAPATVMTLLVVARLPLARRLASNPPTAHRHPIGCAFVWLAWIGAAGWGLTVAVTLHQAGYSEGTYLLIMATAGVAAGATAALSVSERIIVPYVVVLQAPLCVATTILGLSGRGTLVMPLMYVMFTGYIVFMGARLSRAYQSKLSVIVDAQAAVMAAEAKRRFLASVAHELRTPMNGIMGVSDLLKETEVRPEQVELLATFDEASKALLRIIDEVLDFAKAEDGHVEIINAPFSPTDCVEEVVGVMEPVARSKQLELSMWFAQDLPELVIGDQGRLRQILINLAGNAIKFSRVGGVHFQVRRRAAGPGLRLSVTDTGPGLEAGFQPFEPFAQGAAGAEHGGTGLGLAICDRLTKLMGGAIGFEQADRGGTTFWLEVPFETHTPRRDPPRFGRAAWVIDRWAPGRSATVQLLRRCGVHAEAVAHDAGPPPPGIDVWLAIDDATPDTQDELTRLRGPDTRLVVMTTRERHAAMSDVLGGRADFVTTRPLTHRLVERVLDRHPSPDVSRAGPRPRVELDSPRRVLIVEDNRVNRMVAERFVREAGFDSEVAHSGREALLRFSETSWDAILLDCRMPEMDGWETARAIRRLEADSERRVSIIAMTADVEDLTRERCFEAGMDAYLPKPVDPAALVNLLRQVTKA